MIRVLIADDHQLMLDGLAKIIEDIPDMELAGTVLDGKAVLQFLQSHMVDIILLDINMPGLNGVEVCKRVTKKYPDVQVIALSMYKRQSYIQRMLQFGAKGYLLKDDRAKEIENGIRQVVAGEHYFSSQIKLDLFSLVQKGNQSQTHTITPREIEILECIAYGLTNQEISEKLFLSQHTVESHRKNILSKLQAKNTADLIRLAIEKGLI